MVRKYYNIIFILLLILAAANFLLLCKKNQKISQLAQDLKQEKTSREFLHEKIKQFSIHTKNIAQIHRQIKQILKNTNTNYIQNFDPNNYKIIQTRLDTKNIYQVKTAVFLQEQELELLALQSNSLLAETSYKSFLLNTIPSLKPTSGYISSLMGVRYHPILGIYRGHKGIDIAALPGTPVYAPAQGIIKSARFSQSMGLLIEIMHDFDLQTRFGHLSKIYVKNKAHVERGQLIGLVGNTGTHSDGPHLHYEVRHGHRVLDPVKFLIEKPGALESEPHI